MIAQSRTIVSSEVRDGRLWWHYADGRTRRGPMYQPDTPPGAAGILPTLLPTSGTLIISPAPLPPVIEYTDEIRSCLADAERAIARLDAAVRTAPDLDHLLATYGTMSARSHRTRHIDTVRTADYRAALQYGLEAVREGAFSFEMLREMNERLIQHPDLEKNRRAEPGAIRDFCINFRSDDAVIHSITPPTAIRPALENLDAFIRADDGIPELVRLALIYAQLLMIHPFTDGNGRTARLMVQLYPVWKGLLPAPLLFFGIAMNRRPMEYDIHLIAIEMEGVFEEWIAFFLRGIIEAADTARTAIKTDRPCD